MALKETRMKSTAERTEKKKNFQNFSDKSKRETSVVLVTITLILAISSLH